jgi:hypothetical protein
MKIFEEFLAGWFLRLQPPNYQQFSCESKLPDIA